MNHYKEVYLLRGGGGDSLGLTFPSLPGMRILLQLAEMTVGVARLPIILLAWVNGAVMLSTGIHYLTISPRIKSSLLHGFQQSFSKFVFSV